MKENTILNLNTRIGDDKEAQDTSSVLSSWFSIFFYRGELRRVTELLSSPF